MLECGARRRDRRGRRRRVVRAGCCPTPGGLDPRPPARARPRGRRLRLAQPLARQRDQVLRRRRAQARRRRSRRGSRRSVERRGAGRRAGGDSIGRVRALEGAARRLPARARARVPARPLGPADRARLRQRRHLPRRAGDLRRLGADVEAIAAEPDGRNINEGCGSTHPEALAERVAASGAAIGFAFDGDGDRVLAVDSDGSRSATATS